MDLIEYYNQRYSDKKKRRIKRKQNQQHRKTTKSYFEYIVELLNDNENGICIEDIDIDPPERMWLKNQ